MKRFRIVRPGKSRNHGAPLRNWLDGDAKIDEPACDSDQERFDNLLKQRAAIIRGENMQFMLDERK